MLPPPPSSSSSPPSDSKAEEDGTTVPPAKGTAPGSAPTPLLLDVLFLLFRLVEVRMIQSKCRIITATDPNPDPAAGSSISSSTDATSAILLEASLDAATLTSNYAATRRGEKRFVVCLERLGLVHKGIASLACSSITVEGAFSRGNLDLVEFAVLESNAEVLDGVITAQTTGKFAGSLRVVKLITRNTNAHLLCGSITTPLRTVLSLWSQERAGLSVALEIATTTLALNNVVVGGASNTSTVDGDGSLDCKLGQMRLYIQDGAAHHATAKLQMWARDVFILSGGTLNASLLSGCKIKSLSIQAQKPLLRMCDRTLCCGHAIMNDVASLTLKLTPDPSLRNISARGGSQNASSDVNLVHSPQSLCDTVDVQIDGFQADMAISSTVSFQIRLRQVRTIASPKTREISLSHVSILSCLRDDMSFPTTQTELLVCVSIDASQAPNTSMRVVSLTDLALTVEIGTILDILEKVVLTHNMLFELGGMTPSTSTSFSLRSTKNCATAKRGKDSLHCTLTNVSVKLQLAEYSKLALCADFRKISVLNHETNTKLPARIEIECFSLSMIRRHAGLLRLASLPLLSIEQSRFGAEGEVNKQGGTVIIDIRGESLVEIPNRAEFGQCLDVLLLQIAAAKTNAKSALAAVLQSKNEAKKSSAPQEAHTIAPSHLRIQCESLGVAVGENADASDCALWVKLEGLSLRLARISDKQTLEKALCDLDTCSRPPLGHGFSVMLGAMCSASLRQLHVSLGVKTFPVELVSLSGVSINANEPGALLLAELRAVPSQCRECIVRLPSQLRPTEGDAVAAAEDDILLNVSISRAGVPVKVYHDLKVVANEARVGHGVVLNRAMEALDVALHHLLPPPPLPPSGVAALEKLSWWDNLRYMTHGKLSLTAGRLAVHLFGPSGTQEDGDHLKIACEDAQIILTKKQKATIRLHNARIGILPLSQARSSPDLFSPNATALDVVRLPSLILEATWKWACAGACDPDNHYVQLHSDLLPGCKDKFAHFRSMGVTLALSFNIGANSFVSLNWNRWPWILEFVAMYSETPERFRAYSGPARKSLAYPMARLDIDVVSSGALSLLWCNSEATSDSGKSDIGRLGIIGVVDRLGSRMSLSKEASSFGALSLGATSITSDRAEFTICVATTRHNEPGCPDPLLRGFAAPAERKLMTISSFELGLEKNMKSSCVIRGAQILFNVFTRDNLEAIVLTVVGSGEEGKGNDASDDSLVASGHEDDSDEEEAITGLAAPMMDGRRAYKRYKSRKSTLKGNNADLLSVLVGRVERVREGGSGGGGGGGGSGGTGCSDGGGGGISVGENGTPVVSSSRKPLSARPRSDSGAGTPRTRDRISSVTSTGSSNVPSRDSMDGIHMNESEIDFEITFVDVQVQFCSHQLPRTMQTPIVLAAKTARLRQSPASLQVNAEAVVGFAMDTDAFLSADEVHLAITTPIHSRGGRHGALAHRVLDTPSLVVTSHSVEQTLTILVPELKASTSPDELTAIVNAVTKVILAPPASASTVERGTSGSVISEVSEVSSAAASDTMGDKKEVKSNPTPEDVRVAAHAYAENTTMRNGAARPRVLVNTITYRLRSLDLRLCPQGAEEFEINMYDFRGTHHQFLDCMGPGEEYEICVADLSMQNLKPSMVEMESFEDPMSIFEAVLEDRSQALYRRKETMFRITACTQDVSKMQGVRLYERFEVALFPGATGTVHMQITSSVANKLMDFVLGAGKYDDDVLASATTEEDDSEALLGKRAPLANAVVGGGGNFGGEEGEEEAKEQGEQDEEQEAVPMFVQRFRMGETTMMLTSRGFGIQLPDKWRVRVKALQLNNVVTSWDELTRVILKHFSTKVAKSLVLKNGAKVILSSLTGKIVQASGSASRDLKAEEEVEDAALLFGATN